MREYKSLQKIRSGDKGFKDLAVTCVSLANTQGGKIFIGYDDKTKLPPENQTINTKEINDSISRLRSLCFNVALLGSEILIHNNGSQYFTIDVSPSLKSIATSSDGKIYIRVADKCEPVRNEDIHRLAYEKQAYQWEDEEILKNYNFTDGNFLTFLGILWLGNAQQRSRIAYPITVQYIVYDHLERKVRKIDWHDNLLNPAELLLDIEHQAIELTYFHEFPDGLFRKQIRHYHPKVIRVMQDLNLMEGEGSGYDLIYELNAMYTKELPIIYSDFNTTKVVQTSKIVNDEMLPVLGYVTKHYDISQKNLMALGLIAANKKVLSTELTNLLQLDDNKKMRSYVDNLVNSGIVITRGIKKGNEFLINPKVITNSKADIQTSLKTIEPHRLKALIEEDIRLHQKCKSSEIQKRLLDIPIKEIRKYLALMEKEGIIESEGMKKTKVYLLSKKN